MGSILDKLFSTPAGEILTFRAFDYQLGDVSVPLNRRFAGREVLMLTIGSRSMKLGMVAFDLAGKAHFNSPSQVLNAKSGGALTDHLKAAVRSVGKKGATPWVVVMIANGWTVEKVPANYHGSDYDRMIRIREMPEDVVGKPLAMDQEHAVVPHPMLDASLVFSVRQSLIIPILESVNAAGLRVARVQIPIAALFETFVRTDPEGAQARDILAVDHQGAMLLQVQKKEWTKIRYRSTQPGEMAADLAKFLVERPEATAPLTLLGDNNELISRVLAEQGIPTELVVPFEKADPEFQAAAAFEKESFISHDLNPERPPARPPLPKFARVFVIGYLLAALTLVGIIVGNMTSALSRESMSSSLEREKSALETRIANGEAEERRVGQEIAKADEIASWVRIGYHPQRFLLAIIRAVPETVVLGSVEGKLSEGLLQMDLVVNLEGSPEAQSLAMSKIEQAIYAQGIRIVTREPAPNGNRSISYRLTLIMPAPGDATPL